MKIHYFVEQIPHFIEYEIKSELKKDLPSFDYIEAHYKSAYKDDEYLYLVLAKKENEYAFWTYNTTTKSFNLGHYGFTSELLALNTMYTYFYE